MNQFLHAPGNWSISGRITAQGMSIRITPSGTLKAKPRCTPSFSRTAFLSSMLTMSTRSSPSTTRISRLSLAQPGASDSTSSEATSGPDSLTVIFAGPDCCASFTSLAEHVVVAVQADARLRVAQFGVDGRTAEACDRARGRIELERDGRTAERRCLRPWRWPSHGGLAGGDRESAAGQRRNVLGQEGQFAGGKPLRGNRLAVGIGDHVARGALLLRQHDQIGPRPAGGVEHVDGRRRSLCRSPRSASAAASNSRDCASPSSANACLIFHWSLTNGTSGSVMLLYAPQVCSS